MRTAKMFIVFLFVVFLCGCGLSQPAPRNNSTSDYAARMAEIQAALDATRYNQDLSDAENEKVLYYGELANVSVDNLLDQNYGESFEIDLNRAVYEIYSLLRLFGLHEALTIEEKSIAAKAIFENIPKDIKTGTPIRNIIVPAYFADNSPLILHVTFAYSGERHPTIAVLSNTRGNIRRSDYKVIQESGAGFKYPRITTVDGRMTIQSENNYTLALLADNIITASSSIDKELPAIDINGDTLEMLNLTDEYLRDGNPANDDDVLPLLFNTIDDNENKPIDRLFAHMQLFMYYLFQDDLKNAGDIIQVIDESGFLDDPSIAGTEVADIPKNDMRNILELIDYIKSNN